MEKGTVYFFTGLAGAGKTTLGTRFYQHLKAKRPDVVLFDGDVLRDSWNTDVDYSTQARRRSARRVFHLCQLLSEQGISIVICSIAMYEDIRAWNRENLANYREIYVRVTQDTLYRRDQKGLYSAGTQVVGKDLPWDEPQHPDLIVQNDGAVDPDTLVEQIEAALQKQEDRPQVIGMDKADKKEAMDR